MLRVEDLSLQGFVFGVLCFKVRVTVGARRDARGERES